MKLAGDVEATQENMNPQPPAWPVCDTCDVPYVLRRAFSFGSGSWSWAWMRDCEKPKSTCKNASAVMYDAEGAVPSHGR